ncbi:hypothetical protein [Pontibacter pamirensis]|uniref:hypothetical protein n=1 Tax=Pontibacter pamirensis TaxID=2562824 RepID=UPI001389533E|nr:hypothetical protein [Pontibacter pamirensis]
MKKLFPCSLLLLLFCFLFTSCDERNDNVLPVAELSVERTFTSTATTEVNAASYTEETVTGDFINNDGELVVIVSASAEGGRDHVFFTVLAENLKHNNIGRYTLK